MPYEVKITATFTTGTTAADIDEAKKECEDVFIGLLKMANVISRGLPSGIFECSVDKVEAEKL